MNIVYKIITKLRQLYLSRRLKSYSGSGFIAYDVKFTNEKNITLGSGCIINSRVWIATLERKKNVFGEIKIGSGVMISRDCILASAFGVIIGDGVTLGPRVAIYDNNHNIYKCDESVMSQGLSGEEVSIGDYAWLGLGVIVLPGVKIGKGVIVGAGSVVTKSIPDYKIAVGNPARVIGGRRDKSNA